MDGREGGLCSLSWQPLESRRFHLDMLEYVVIISNPDGLGVMRVKWNYDERATYYAICPNTGWELSIERIPIRQIHTIWQMIVDNGEHRIPAGEHRRLSEAQRRFESWIESGSPEHRLGYI